jgi:DNA polymerase elongation subunit (family B)
LQQLDTEDHRDIDILGFSYQGGFVLEPKPGLYRNLKVVDVVCIYLSISLSLYSSIAILNNISFDTLINSPCCMDREDAKRSLQK